MLNDEDGSQHTIARQTSLNSNVSSNSNVLNRNSDYINNNKNKKNHRAIDPKVHNTDMYYQFATGYLRDVCYSNMLYKQRSTLHKQIEQLLDKKEYNKDKFVQHCVKRHRLLKIQGIIIFWFHYLNFFIIFFFFLKLRLLKEKKPKNRKFFFVMFVGKDVIFWIKKNIHFLKKNIHFLKKKWHLWAFGLAI